MEAADLDQINTLLDTDSELRERIKDQVNEFDKKTRLMVATLNKIHFTPPDTISALLDTVKSVIVGCQSVTKGLAEIVPPNQFWRWKDMWSNSLKTAVFASVLVEYLSSGQLAGLQQVSDQLGMREEWKDRVSLTVEDYLHGVISVVNELSRLAVNSVTLGNFDQPIKISHFVKELFAGFSMLNLKNDTLRRRFDSLKYDMKKIEEVVYDVSLRKLATVPIVPST
ncbi:translin [Coprinellus micaceus]|uniref:Translin n=1 Tax=Coprinellus micaceus TaxID=71717 RepID=A0A4Y7U101_COPMI|nr:translin [Coprinellus micaceus]